MSITDNIIETVDILTNNKIKKLQLDKTVKGVILERTNLTIGEYLVEYEKGKFLAYSNNLEDQYQIGEKVYIKIPQNNTNNKKIIEGYADKEDDINKRPKTKIKNKINDVGAAWENIYSDLGKKINNEELLKLGLHSGEEKKELIIYDRNEVKDKEQLKLNDDIFLNYSQQYDKICIKADFFSCIDINKNGQGNYGLKLIFIARDLKNEEQNNSFGETEISYQFDINNFNGNPYKYNLFSPQKMIINVEKGYLLKLKSIILFQEGFKLEENSNKFIDNIKIKNIHLSFCEEINLSQSGFLPLIMTPNGVDLIDDNPVELIGDLLFNGLSVINKKTSTIEWFVRDPNIKIEDKEYYDEDVGEGWKKIAQSNSLLIYSNNSNKMESNSEQVKYLKEYLVKINYNKNYYTTQVVVKNYNSLHNLNLIQKNDKDNLKDIYLILNNKNNNYKYYGKWYYQYNNSSIIEIKENKRDKIKINDYLKCDQVVFLCEVYREDNNEKICCLEKCINRVKDKKEFSIDFIGIDSYNYNADGDMPLENTERFQRLFPKILWNDGYASAYKIDWIINDISLVENKYNNPDNTFCPLNSMLKDIYVDNKGGLNYRIKQKYNEYDNNNILILRITTINNTKHEVKKEILFVKTGDQGTNGTKYISAIRPVDLENNKLLGFQPILLEEKSGKQRIKNFIYKDGKPIENDNENYEIKYNWESEKENLVLDSENDRINIFNIESLNEENSVVEISLNENLVNSFYSERLNNLKENYLKNKRFKEKLIIKCKVEIYNKKAQNENDKKIILYYNYPVSIIIKKNKTLDISKLKVQIPNYIKYNPNGINATYLNNNIEFKYGTIDCIKELKSGDDNLIKIASESTDGNANVYKIIPASSFNYSKGITYLYGEFLDGFIIYPIMMFLDTFGNEAINGWDGTSINIENKSNNNKKGSLLAPQIGAGIKSPEGKFTGVVMGEDTTQKEIGLYGYSKGINNFGLMANGKAYFGQSIETGRIDFDGTSGIIQGGGGGREKTGMTIQLASFVKDDNGNPKIDIETKKVIQDEKIKAIQVANENFYVTYGGLIHSIAGDIGGWILKNDGLYSPDTIFPSKNSNEEPKGAIMLQSRKIDNQGRIEQEAKATIEKGLVGGWVISKDGIYSPDTEFQNEKDTTLTNRGSIMLISTRELEVFDKKTGITEKIKGPVAIIDRGEIGKWVVTDELIHSNPKSEENVAKTILDSKKSIITTQTFNIVMKDGNEDKKIGYMGMISGKEGTTGKETHNLGLETDEDNKSIILNSKKANVRVEAEYSIYENAKDSINMSSINSFNVESGKIKIGTKKEQQDIAFMGVDNEKIELRGIKVEVGTGGGAVVIGHNQGSITCNVKPENQKGIYARFA